jgi:hypothetical protein
MHKHKRILIALLLAVSIAGGLWGMDVLADRKYQIEVVSPTELFSLPPHEYPPTNPTISTLKKGQLVRVLRLRYGKDFQAFRVETTDGLIGWVIQGEGIRVMSQS